MGENSDWEFLTRFLAGEAQGADLANASPIAHELGASLLALDQRKGAATLSCRFKDNHLNGAGVITGGILATALDFAMALAILARLGEGGNAASIHLDSQFYNPARPGIYTAEARVERMSSRVAFMGAKLSDAEGKRIAAATSIMALKLSNED